MMIPDNEIEFISSEGDITDFLNTILDLISIHKRKPEYRKGNQFKPHILHELESVIKHELWLLEDYRSKDDD